MGVLDFFKNRGWGGGGNPSQLEMWEIKSSIKVCCEKRVLASVLIDDHAIGFLSMFIDSNPGKKRIILDTLTPDMGNNYIKGSKSVSISYNLNDITHSFRCNYIGRTNGKSPAIKISYPRKIECSQKRECFRVKPPTEEPVLLSARVHDEKELEIKGILHDLSEGGLSFIVSSEFAGRLKPGKSLSEIRFDLPDIGAIKTKGVVRHIFNGQDESYNCGLEFVDLTDAQRITIYGYVLERQRDIIRKPKKGET